MNQKPTLQLRLIVVEPPEGVTMAVQRGKDALLPPASVTESSLVFEFPVVVTDDTTIPVRLTGEFTQGPAAERFVYVNSGTLAGQVGSPWTNRAKVPITNITQELARAAIEAKTPLIAHVAGKSPKGGPFVASVKLLSGWTLVAE
ncbi:MAG: DUF5990 family protein [Armatimonas sp.]